MMTAIATISRRLDDLVQIKIQSPSVQSKYAVSSLGQVLDHLNDAADLLIIEQEGSELKRFDTPVPLEDIEPWIA